jgi:hypothetical protein
MAPSDHSREQLRSFLDANVASYSAFLLFLHPTGARRANWQIRFITARVPPKIYPLEVLEQARVFWPLSPGFSSGETSCVSLR